MLSLYNIAEEFRNLMEAVENGEIPEEALADTLESIDAAFDVKAENIACLIKNLKAEAEAIKAESSKLAERSKAKSNQADRLKSYLEGCMSQMGKEKLETTRVVLKLRNTPPALKVDTEVFLPWVTRSERTGFLRYKEPELDKTAIKKAVQSGETLPGVTLVSGKSLVIQ